MLLQAGTRQRVQHVTVVALYERDSGAIKHCHTVVNFEGGRSVSENEAIEAARQQADRLGHPTDQLEIAVSGELEHATTPHRIEPTTGAFRPLEHDLSFRTPPD